MTLEIPEFERCCFCLPLRAGLLTWAYLKLLADILMTPFLAIYACYFFMIYSMAEDIDFEFFAYAAMLFITLTGVLLSVVPTLIFTIGVHKKEVKWIRGFYTYSIWELRVMTLLIVVAVVITVKYLRPDAVKLCTVYLLILVLHAYFLLLLRSVVNKLQKNGSSDISSLRNSAEPERIISNQYIRFN